MPVAIRITDTFCEIFSQEIKYAISEETGERVQLPSDPHGTAIALGDFAIRDDSDKSVPTFDRPIIGYREDDYRAAQQAKIEAVVGKDLAPLIAGLALKSAQVEDQRLQVVALAQTMQAQDQATRTAADKYVAAAMNGIHAQADAIIADAETAASQIIDAAKAEAAKIVDDAKAQASLATTDTKPLSEGEPK